MPVGKGSLLFIISFELWMTAQSYHQSCCCQRVVLILTFVEVLSNKKICKKNQYFQQLQIFPNALLMINFKCAEVAINVKQDSLITRFVWLVFFLTRDARLSWEYMFLTNQKLLCFPVTEISRSI